MVDIVRNELFDFRMLVRCYNRIFRQLESICKYFLLFFFYVYIFRFILVSNTPNIYTLTRTHICIQYILKRIVIMSYNKFFPENRKTKERSWRTKRIRVQWKSLKISFTLRLHTYFIFAQIYLFVFFFRVYIHSILYNHITQTGKKKKNHVELNRN